MSSSLRNAVEFDGGYALGTPSRAELREGFGKHQVAILDFAVPRGTTRRIPPEMTPLAYRWGYGPSSLRSFVGYVNHHEILDSADTSVLRLFTAGTSLPMNNPNPRSWTRVTASYVAREIGARHGLRVVLHKSPEILPYWTQGNETDFVMLQRLAKRAGFRVWVDGSTLYFLDPRKLVRTPRLQDLQVFTLDGNASHDTLYRLHTISGSLAPRAGTLTRNEVYGIDSKSGSLIKATSNKVLSDQGHVQPSNKTINLLAADGPFEARRLAEASVSNGTWVVQEAEVAPNSKTRLGDVVRLGGSQIATGSEGLWLVSGTVQVIENANRRRGSSLSTTLELTRDQQDALTYRASSALSAPRNIQPILRSTGRWEAHVLEDVYV